MRILFVAMPWSVHTARWIGQLPAPAWDLHLFPSMASALHPGLDHVTVYDVGCHRPAGLSRSVRLRGIWPFARGDRRLGQLVHQVRPAWADRARWLARVIEWLKPDVVHSLEVQRAGYLALDARRHVRRPFPLWIVTNWGSDLYLYGRLAAHVDRIKTVLAACDAYWCECERDVGLARQLGFAGTVLPVLPNTGGFDLAHAAQLRSAGPPSARRLILVKGYQNWAGRALVALRAIQLCADAVRAGGYRVAIYAASPDVEIAAELLARSIGVPVDVVPPVSHGEMLRLFGQARVYLGLSISDAISISLLEAMVMGTFPIQSCTACADEWVSDGETGLIVPPEDPHVVAEALRRAITDDELLDRAGERNAETAARRLDRRVIQPQVVAAYERVLAEAGGRARRCGGARGVGRA